MKLLLAVLLYSSALLVSGDREQIKKDPDEDRNATQLISSKGYKAEEHVVQTDDGYLITVHRIPCARDEATRASCTASRPVVFLQHGLECDSTNWITNLANESLAFILADRGFDVWMGNMRGNLYARKHITLSPSDPAFWDFSFDEMAAHDIPAMVNYALSVTGQPSLYYVGHSQGTLVGFIQFSQDVQFAKKIKHFYAMGPVTTVKHIKGPLKYLAPFTKEIDVFAKVFGVNDFTIPPSVEKVLGDLFCPTSIGNPLCEDVLFLICGPDMKQLNTSRIPVYISHTPSGTSTKNVAHFGQMINSGCFCKYDYGRRKNKEVYGQYTAPSYNASKMQTPVSLFWGGEDWLADPTDIESNLLPALQNLHGNYRYDSYNHLDFLWAMNAPSQVYSKIAESMAVRERWLIEY